MSSRRRSRSVPRDVTGISNPIRARSVSRPPTSHLPLDRDNGDTFHTKGTSNQSLPTYTSVPEPEFNPPAVSQPPTPSKPLKSIIKNWGSNSSSPLRQSSTLFPGAVQVPALGQPFRDHNPSRGRSFSSVSYNSPASKPSAPAKPAQTLNSQSSAMGVKTVASAAGAKKKSIPSNGIASKKSIDLTEEGSSSSDEESSESSSESSSDEEPSTPANKPKAKSNAVAAKANGKKNTAPSTSSESESDSSDESDDDTKKQKVKKEVSQKPAVAATNGVKRSLTGGAKAASAIEIPDSSTDSSSEEEEEVSDEDSDEEMNDAPPSGQGQVAPSYPSGHGILKKRAREPAPSVIDGTFKLQKAQSLDKAVSLFNEANGKGERVWVLSHSSSAPLNVEVQQVYTAAENQRNKIAPSSARLTFPVTVDGKSTQVLSGCDSIIVTQTVRGKLDIPKMTSIMEETMKSTKEIPKQPEGIRPRFTPIGVQPRATSPKLGESPAATQPKSKKDKKKKDRDVVEPSSERPSKKQKVAGEAAERKTKAEKVEGSTQPSDFSKATKPDGEKKKKSKKSKSHEETEETPSSSKKVKFAQDEAAASAAPVPFPDLPSSQTKSKSKKKRRSSNEDDPPEKKKGDKASSWARPEDVKMTPIKPPTVPGMR
ncbi:uncharacterized protein DNG_03933 [Cephalotrichum gorgonifer]|uniref:Uncharacterized protein n=1 Tax=Cephalotrichum gorgonifer TaxID=2041049 RepID=A0AAE8SU33_9PEZI|nr:uncharacterized protein DNG_03933 [Cephalotrichum gorgonifer]